MDLSHYFCRAMSAVDSTSALLMGALHGDAYEYGAMW
jgi:hypothetical protein